MSINIIYKYVRKSANHPDMTHLIPNMNTLRFQHGTSTVLKQRCAFPGVDHSSMIIPQIINPPMALVHTSTATVSEQSRGTLPVKI